MSYFANLELEREHPPVDASPQEILNAQLDDIKRHIHERIPAELQDYIFTRAMDIDSFVNYVYFDLLATWFSTNSKKRALNTYTSAFLAHATKELSADYENYHNIVAQPYVGSSRIEGEETDNLQQIQSHNRKLQRKIIDMLQTDPISIFYEDKNKIHRSTVNYDLRNSVQNIHQGKRFNYEVSVLYYYESLSEIFLKNEKGAKLRRFADPKLSAQKIEAHYKEVACFIRDVLTKSNNFGDLVDETDDHVARAITLSHMDDHAKLYSSLLVSQMVQWLEKKNPKLQSDHILNQMVPILFGRYTPEQFIQAYASPEIQSFLSEVVRYVTNPTLNSSSPILVLPAFLEEMNSLLDNGSDASHIPIRFFTWKLLMEYFKIDISDHAIILDYNTTLFSLFITEKYDIIKYYSNFADYFLANTKKAKIPKPLAKILHIVSAEILHPDFEKNPQS